MPNGSTIALSVVVVVFYLSTDTETSPARVVEEYTLRRAIETTHGDSKLFTGLNDCRLRSEKSVEAWRCLSLMATGILEYLRRQLARSVSLDHSAGGVLQVLRMRWYHPRNLTRGLVCCHLRHCLLSGHDDPTSSRADLFTKYVVKPLTA